MLEFAVKNPFYQWEPELRRYRDKGTGRFLSKKAIATLTSQHIQIITEDLQKVGQLLTQNQITLNTWQQEVAQTLKSLHIQQFLLGAGGEGAVVLEDYLTVGRELKRQYQYLRNFAQDIASGKVSVNQFPVRLGMYAEAAKVSYFAGEKTAAIKAGYTHAKRVLGVAEHCPDCIAYAGMGKVAIADLILPTQNCQCKINCKCSVEYFDG